MQLRKGTWQHGDGCFCSDCELIKIQASNYNDDDRHQCAGCTIRLDEERVRKKVSKDFNGDMERASTINAHHGFNALTNKQPNVY